MDLLALVSSICSVFHRKVINCCCCQAKGVDIGQLSVKENKVFDFSHTRKMRRQQLLLSPVWTE